MSSRHDSTPGARLTGAALLVACPPGAEPEGARRVGRGADGSTLVLQRAGAGGNGETVSLQTLTRRLLSPLSAADRNRLVDALARAGDGGSLSRSLHALREALRERLPRYTRGTAEPRGLVADSVLRLDEHSFYLEGWAVDAEARIVRLEAVSPEGERVDLHSRAFRFPLPHVSAHFGDADGGEQDVGFVCFVELEGPSRLDDGWVVEMENAEGEAAIWALNTDWLQDRVRNLIPNKLRALDKDPHVGKATFIKVFLKEPQLAVYAINPYRRNERLSIQQGVFLCPGRIDVPFEDNLVPILYEADAKGQFFKFRINVDVPERREILKHLQRMNIFKAALFPGLEGFAQSLTTSLAFPDALAPEPEWLNYV